MIFGDDPNGANGTVFVRYTLPALELRMMLLAMRLRREGFELEYVQISGRPPLMGDHAEAEAWRATGCGRRVRLRERPGSARSCTVVDTCAASSNSTHRPALRQWRRRQRCPADELAVLDAEPGWLARKLVLGNPYPILDIPGRGCSGSG